MTGTNTTDQGSGGLRSKLGLPRIAGHGNLASAAVIDSLGSGLLLAFIVVYFAQTTDLSLPAIGGAITLARFLAIPTAMVVGPIVDRVGVRLVALSGNLISAIGYGGFLLAEDVWQVIVVCLLTQVGAVTYWTSSNGLVALAADGNERTRWFATLHMLRNVGLGVGGALGALLIGAAGTSGLHGVVIANAASYVVAAFLLARWKPNRVPPTEKASAETVKGGYLTVLRDRRYMLLVAINVSFVFAALILSVLLAIYITEGLRREAWIAGALLVMNTIQIALTQTVFNRLMERFRGTRVIATACGINALAFGIFAFLDAAPSSLIVAGLFFAIFLYTLAEAIATPLSEDLSVTLAPESMRGRYLAVYQLSWTFGQTVAPALFTSLLAQGSRWPWLFLVATSLIAAPAMLLLERMMNDREAGAEPPADETRPGEPVAQTV